MVALSTTVSELRGHERRWRCLAVGARRHRGVSFTYSLSRLICSFGSILLKCQSIQLLTTRLGRSALALLHVGIRIRKTASPCICRISSYEQPDTRSPSSLGSALGSEERPATDEVPARLRLRLCCPPRPTLCTYVLSAVRLTGFGMDPAKYLRLRAAFNAPTADWRPRVGQVRRVPTWRRMPGVPQLVALTTPRRTSDMRRISAVMLHTKNNLVAMHGSGCP